MGRTLLVVMGMLVGTTLGVACSAVPENRYFTMAYVLLPAKGPAAEASPSTLRVRQLEVTPAYDTERLVYRYSPYEFQYYNYMLWATKPQKMFTDLMIRHLEHAGIFTEVGLEYGDRRPDFELYGVLRAIEELDSGDEWYAHLSFSMRMNRYRDEKVVWTHDADVRKRVYNKAPVYVVKALSELLEQEMQRLVKSLRTFLRTRSALRGAKP